MSVCTISSEEACAAARGWPRQPRLLSGEGDPNGTEVGYWPNDQYLDVDTGILYIFNGTPGTKFGWAASSFGVINIQSLGADPTGVEDSSPAFALALAQIPDSNDAYSPNPLGWVIFVPPGEYRITQSISVAATKKGVKIIGANRDNTIIQADFVGYAIDAQGTNSGSGFNKDLEISGLKFQSGNTTRPAGSGAIRVRYYHYFLIHDCWFSAHDETGIYVEDALDFWLNNLRIDSPSGTNENYTYGISLLRSNDLSFGAPNEVKIGPHVEIEDTYQAAIRIENAESVKVYEGLIQSNERNGIEVENSGDITIEKIYFEANGQADVAECADIFVQDLIDLTYCMVVRDNHFSADQSSAHFYAARFNDVRGLFFQNNNLRGGVAQEIYVDSACKDVTIIDNWAVTTALEPIINIANGVHARFQNRKRDGSYWTGYINTEKMVVQDLAYATPLDINLCLGTYIRIAELTGDIVINTPTGAQGDDTVCVEISQDATGGRRVSWSGQYVVKRQEDRRASKKTIYTFHYNSTDGKYYEESSSGSPAFYNDEVVEFYGDGGFLHSTNFGNNVNRSGRIGCRHYAGVSEEPFYGVVFSSAVGGQTLLLGGGSATGNAANEINFYTTVGTTDLTGTLQIRINNGGDFFPNTSNNQDNGTFTRKWRRMVAASGICVGSMASQDASALLQVDSTSQGVLLPRMTKAQRDAIGTPANGLLIYQTDGTAGVKAYIGGAWYTLDATADP